MYLLMYLQMFDYQLKEVRNYMIWGLNTLFLLQGGHNFLNTRRFSLPNRGNIPINLYIHVPSLVNKKIKKRTELDTKNSIFVILRRP